MATQRRQAVRDGAAAFAHCFAAWCLLILCYAASEAVAQQLRALQGAAPLPSAGSSEARTAADGAGTAAHPAFQAVPLYEGE